MAYALPNLLAGVRSFLAAHAAVAAVVAGRVYALRTPPSPAYPLVLLTDVTTDAMVGSTDKLASARIQVECYGTDSHDEAAAHHLAVTCHAAFHDLADEPGFTGFSDVAGLQPLPDRELGKARYIFEVRVYGYTPHD